MQLFNKKKKCEKIKLSLSSISKEYFVIFVKNI